MAAREERERGETAAGRLAVLALVNRGRGLRFIGAAYADEVEPQCWWSSGGRGLGVQAVAVGGDLGDGEGLWWRWQLAGGNISGAAQ